MENYEDDKIIDDKFTEIDPLKQNSFKEEPKPKRSLIHKCTNIVSSITVEPTIFLFVLVAIININVSQNLNLEKACRVNLNYTKEICDSLKLQDLGIQNEFERESQKLLASALTWKTYLSTTIPCILALFTGSFSDKTGHRKLFIAVSILGQIIICANYMLHVFYFYELRLEFLVFSDALIEGLTGGWCISFLSVFAFISTITTNEERTFRMGLVNFCLTVAFPIGMGTSGILLKKYGYYGCFGVTTALGFINLMYITLIVKDPPRNMEQKKHDGKGMCHYLRTFFNPNNVKDTMKVLYRKTPNNRRARLFILLATVCVLFGPMYGEVSIMYMTTRYRFNWDEVKFSLFQTYNFITHTIGTIFSILVFSKYLQWHDSLLGIISTVSKIAASFVYAFAPNEKIFYIAPLVEILNGTSLLVMRSIFSKMVEPNELGSINSLIGLTENLMPLVYVPMYTMVYSATMEDLPGAVFLIGSCMTLPATCVLSYLFYEHRKQVRKSKMANGMNQN